MRANDGCEAVVVIAFQEFEPPPSPFDEART